MEAGDVVPVHHELSHGAEWALLLVSVLVALGGIGAAFQAYLQNPDLATSLRERFAGLYRVLEHKYWVDEIYDAWVVQPFMAASQWLWRVWDTLVVDGLVNGVGYTLELGSGMLKLFQTGFVGTYALWIALGVIALFFHFLR
jgi:NADH-quinone oxidoreductase subunit L